MGGRRRDSLVSGQQGTILLSQNNTVILLVRNTRFDKFAASIIGILLLALTAAPLLAMANPIPAPSPTPSHNPSNPDFKTWQEGVIYIAFVNFPIDLLILSILCLVCCWAFGATRMGRLSRNSAVFVGSVVAAGAVIALAGGAIDFGLLYTHRYYAGLYNDGWYRTDSTPYFFGFLFISASIWLAAVLLPRLNEVASAFIAFVMALVSPISWWILGYNGTVSFPVSWLAIVPVLVVLYLLYQWHAKTMPVKAAVVVETATSGSI
jgi:hypothetical protein